jgi:hypothetical protein
MQRIGQSSRRQADAQPPAKDVYVIFLRLAPAFAANLACAGVMDAVTGAAREGGRPTPYFRSGDGAAASRLKLLCRIDGILQFGLARS